MPPITSSASDSLRAGNRVVAFGIAAIVVILLGAAVFLFMNLPDANAFNAKVERLFVENDNLTTGAEIKLLEILAQSGTSFSEVLVSYRSVIFVLLVFSTALLIASLVFLVTIIALNRRISAIQRSGIQVASMLISREGRAVYINDMEFALTEAALETLAVLAEARMDDEVLTGAQIEVWVGNYVLMTYGDGAVMGVPAHDERDFAFAKKYGIDVRQVVSVAGKDFSLDAWQEWYADKEQGSCVNSGRYDGLGYVQAVDAIAGDLKA